ncbi:MAG TPA: 2-dehydro-3-deoxygalactonokinase [Humisphaera sp.]|jgi:2-dehydro-3-deoxygalactonokinase|nr:2-dehydro-3-deoxygalactonokinase [Humisphaera sp.]
MEQETAAAFVDMGTTNTRVWLARGGQILASARAQIGVRDSARDGTNARLREGLRDLLAEVIRQSRSHANFADPRCVIAAGMITSSLGLSEVPHLEAPAGLRELALGVRRFQFPDVTELPILLVPGIRTGKLTSDAAQTCAADIMRGEETLCMGLIANGLAPLPGVVLNLGSHWKAISLDEKCRIVGSITSLSGEMIHAVQTTTILASALPQERPQVLDTEWLEAGMTEQRASGLARALFCVRLLEQAKATTAEQRLAFLAGATIASDLDALLSKNVLRKRKKVTLIGHPALAGAWRHALDAASIGATIVTEQQTDNALLAGLGQILGESDFA